MDHDNHCRAMPEPLLVSNPWVNVFAAIEGKGCASKVKLVDLIGERWGVWREGRSHEPAPLCRLYRPSLTNDTNGIAAVAAARDRRSTKGCIELPS